MTETQVSPIRQRGTRRAAAGLPGDVILATVTAMVLVLDIEGRFLLGAASPGLTPGTWSVVIGTDLALAFGLSLGVLRDRRVTRLFLRAAGLLAVAWVIPYHMMLAPTVYFGLLVFVPVAAVLSARALVLSLARNERGGREFAIRLLVVPLLLVVMACNLLARPGDWMWLRNDWGLHLGLRMAVTQRVDLAELQSAAVELLEEDSRRPAPEQPLRLYGPEIAAQAPEPIRRLHPLFVMVVPRRGEAEGHVAIAWGRGIMGTWGVRLGRPTFRLAPGARVRRWRDGVYGYVGD
jgi:hypothetical protein